MFNFKKLDLQFLAIILTFFACSQNSERENFDTALKETPVPAIDTVLQSSNSNSQSNNLQDGILISRQTAITRAVEKLKPAVVGITVTQIKEYVPRSRYSDPFFRFFYPNLRYQQEVKSIGSGFIISPQGYILTNEHVIHGAIKTIVSMVDGKKYEAKMIGSDYVTDVALLKIEGKNFPFCELGNSDDIIIGEWVIAIGNPLGLFEQPSVTVGVVSSKNLDFGLQEDERLYQNMIQTDASINPGNSGGPMANALGQVIGMNTFIVTGSESRGSIGLGFASPVNRIKNISEQLMNFGEIDRQYWTGLVVESLRPRVARNLGLINISGVIIMNVESDSPAERAGLKADDIIIKVNGENISSAPDILNVLNTMDAKAGDNILFDFIRKDRTFKTKIKLGKVN